MTIFEELVVSFGLLQMQLVCQKFNLSTVETGDVLQRGHLRLYNAHPRGLWGQFAVERRPSNNCQLSPRLACFSAPTFPSEFSGA